MAIWINCQFAARRVPLADTSAATYGEYVETSTHSSLSAVFVVSGFPPMLQLFGPLQLPLQRRRCSYLEKLGWEFLSLRHHHHRGIDIIFGRCLSQGKFPCTWCTPHHTNVTFHFDGDFSDSLHLIFSLVGVGGLGFPGYFACKVSSILESVHNCMKSSDSKPSHQY